MQNDLLADEDQFVDACAEVVTWTSRRASQIRKNAVGKLLKGSMCQEMLSPLLIHARHSQSISVLTARARLTYLFVFEALQFERDLPVLEQYRHSSPQEAKELNALYHRSTCVTESRHQAFVYSSACVMVAATEAAAPAPVAGVWPA